MIESFIIIYKRNETRGGVLMVKDNKSPKLKTTEPGYENKNNQINVGRTGEEGTDHMQLLYLMECKKCGFKYKANGSDIWQRKCPNCQGGRP
jgi:PHP family Zn ribbon phosphoesterase